MNIDAASMAAQWASYEVTPLENRYNTQLSSITAQSNALSEIKKALQAFDDAMYQYTKPGASLTQSTTQLSQQDFFDVSTSGSVEDINMDLFVEQTATAHQMVLDTNATDQDSVFANGGTIEIEQNGETTQLNLLDADSDGSGDVTYLEFTRFFNNEMDGKINASLVRSDGALKLMFSAEETGQVNAFTISGDAATGMQDTFNTASENPVTQGQDAVVWLGSQGSGAKLTNDSNTFEDIVDGVDVTLKQAQSAGASSVNLQVKKDTSATAEALNEFIDAFNEVMSVIDDKTKSGDESTARGVLASDSTTRNIRSQLNSLIRQEYNGVRLFEVGISIDRNGKLSLDEDKFAEASKSIDVDELFTGTDGVFKSFEKTIDQYTDFTSGSLTKRQENLTQQKERINDSLDALSDRYDMYYSRYLNQFSQLNTIMANMSSVSSLFG